MAWAEPKDVTDAWIGDDEPTDTAKLTVWLGKAEREIIRQVPDLQERIDAEAAETPPRTGLLADAIDVAVAMVTRVFRNPRGERSVSENIGTGPLTEGKTVTYGGDTPGQLVLEPGELAKLQAVTEQGAFEINLLAGSRAAR
ncbi:MULTISPECIES: hypothetical protein [unclassified Leucobacter]|uniref:hypothetical protein n=1 Tax=unclassified Leucobacter TaxID=2621730 RepID=UPI000A418A77|nr:hypothetical protein [Leucobacter sp. Ag1]